MSNRAATVCVNDLIELVCALVMKWQLTDVAKEEEGRVQALQRVQGAPLSTTRIPSKFVKFAG